jgi:hypothetical protein
VLVLLTLPSINEFEFLALQGPRLALNFFLLS